MKWTKIDIVGKRFERWLVIAEHAEKIHGRWWYKCICDCGTEKIVDGSKLRTGGSKSCGCLTREATSKSNSTHRLSKLALYSTWNNIRKRCYDSKVDCYKNYGGRGIRMHEAWINDPPAFIKWCMGNGWQKGLEVDRENNDGHYEPGNLRFITHAQQQTNKRDNVFYTHEGETKCLAEWARTIGIKYHTVCSRIARGWAIKQALFGK